DPARGARHRIPGGAAALDDARAPAGRGRRDFPGGLELPAHLVPRAPLLCRGGQDGGEAVPVTNRLRVLRAERDWSQADLAARLGVSRQTVNAIETGRYDPSLPLAFKIARLFGKLIED